MSDDGRKKTEVLLVEDEGIVAMDLRQRIERLGYRVVDWATSAREAVDAARRHHPQLVLMDVKLRGDEDGISAAQRIQAEQDLPVIFLTAFGDAETLRRAKITHPRGYLLKPFDDRDLSVALELAMHRHEVERRLRRNGDFIAKLFDAVPCPVLAVDENCLIQRSNRSFERIVAAGGATRGACAGALLVGEGGEDCTSCRLSPILERALAGETVRRESLETAGPDGGRRILRISAAPVDLESSRGAIVAIEDVTELAGLRRIVGTGSSLDDLLGQASCMKDLRGSIRKVANAEVPVLIEGESGTGKELVARAIHEEGRRHDGPFVAVHCAALPQEMLSSELFGHEKGAFTGANRRRLGRFERADGGTLFLDEVGEMSLETQVKLLRVIQEGTIERLGGEETLSIDVRIVSATNKRLIDEVRAGRFREDLYYRLCVVPIRVPPLRERQEDVLPLMEQFLRHHAGRLGRSVPRVGEDVIVLLERHPWPGNVRELENTVQHALIECQGKTLLRRHLPSSLLGAEGPRHLKTGRRLDPKRVDEAIAKCKGIKAQAARLLGVSRATLYRFLAREQTAEKG